MNLKHYHKVIAETPPEVRQEIEDWMNMMDTIYEAYGKFCKETERSGGVLCHSSITEWHQYLASELIKKKI